MEAFRRGDFDQIEIVGQADEKEFFELCFKEKILEARPKSSPRSEKKKSAVVVLAGGQSQFEAAPGELVPGL